MVYENYFLDPEKRSDVREQRVFIFSRALEKLLSEIDETKLISILWDLSNELEERIWAEFVRRL